VTASGELFYTKARRPESGPVLVLIHGAGGSRLHWPPQLRRMPGATVYALDLPGHGRAAGSGCETIEGYAAAVASFLEQVVANPAVIVGHSMGGAIAQRLALNKEERVSSLVLVATGARLRVAASILESIQQDFESAVDLITGYAWSSGVDPPLMEVGRNALRDTGADVLLGDFLACDRFDVMRRLGEIELPTLVIGGSADRLTPLKYGQFLEEQIPNAWLMTVEGAGHMVMLERSEQVADAVKSFVMAGR
jgi:pimeloyl-ACP methyl ester carboxylesterase